MANTKAQGQKKRDTERELTWDKNFIEPGTREQQQRSDVLIFLFWEDILELGSTLKNR